MAKSYSKFTYQDLEDLGVTVVQKKLFETLPPLVEPSDFLLKTLEINMRRKMGTEKAKSELILTPILNELAVRNNEEITFFSGYKFDVDKKRGLNGLVDFILTTDTLSPTIKAPVFCIVEAKNDNLDSGVPQCVAEMYAAYTFNEKKEHPTPVVYGSVTYGLAWQFLRLQKNDCLLDTEIFYLNELPQLLGILQHIVDFYR